MLQWLKKLFERTPITPKLLEAKRLDRDSTDLDSTDLDSTNLDSTNLDSTNLDSTKEQKRRAFRVLTFLIETQTEDRLLRYKVKVDLTADGGVWLRDHDETIMHGRVRAGLRPLLDAAFGRRPPKVFMTVVGDQIFELGDVPRSNTPASPETKPK